MLVGGNIGGGGIPRRVPGCGRKVISSNATTATSFSTVIRFPQKLTRLLGHGKRREGKGQLVLWLIIARMSRCVFAAPVGIEDQTDKVKPTMSRSTCVTFPDTFILAVQDRSRSKSNWFGMSCSLRSCLCVGLSKWLSDVCAHHKNFAH